MAAVLPGTGIPVKLTFRASNVKSKDVLSKSDPFLVVYKKLPDGKFQRIGHTEAIRNNENPTWVNGVTQDYLFEVYQCYMVQLFDSDSDSDPNFTDLARHDHIGSAEFQLASVLAAYGQSLDLPIKKPNGELSKSTVTVRGDPLASSRLKAYCTIYGDDLKRGTYLGSKDETILQLIKKRPDGSEMIVYASEMIYDNQDPKYKDFKVCLGQLVEGDLNKEFTLRIIRWKSSSKQEILGELKTTVATIATQPGTQKRKLELHDEKGKKTGHAEILKFEIKEEPEFIEYVQSGLDFNMTVAIDATGSNGDPKLQTSLHYVDYTGKIPNGYIDGLRTVGNIVMGYSQQQWVTALGYGGFVSIDGAAPITSHCFPLTCASQYPFCDGIEGVVGAYVNGFATGKIVLSGPTYLNEVIRSATATAMSRPYTPHYQSYQVLMIFTDGAYNDSDQTIQAICEASAHPLSIIIIGIGNGGGDNWKSMEELDSDGKLLKAKSGLIAKRDIVQFVPLNKYIKNLPELARVTLAEVPNQVLSFMRLHSIQPAQRQAPVAVVHQAAPVPQ